MKASRSLNCVLVILGIWGAHSACSDSESGDPDESPTDSGVTGGASQDGGASAGGSRAGTGGAGRVAGSSAVGGTESGGGSAGGDTTGGSDAGGGSDATGGASASSGGAGTSGSSPSLENCPVFSADSPWNADISGLPVHPNSDNFIDSVGRGQTMHPDFGTEWNGAPNGIPFVLVDASTPDVAINYTAWGDESDPGPFPIPADAPIEGGPDSDGDRHVLVIDTGACRLYELGNAYPRSDGSWDANCGVMWDLTIDDRHPEGCTSADAAGLAIFPGLVRYDEVVEQGAVHHALRVTVSATQRGYVSPASHYASSDTNPDLPPMGLRFRMKSGYDCSSLSSEVQVLCTAFKRYGLIVADNGSDWYVSGAPDPHWSDDNLADLAQIPGSAFEVVDTGDPIVTSAPDCVL